MDYLAEQAGVSRRTLFNYFDSKLQAVLGPEPEFSDEDTATFRNGGPTGHLLSDLGHFAHRHFERMPQEREAVSTMRAVIRDPRVFSACIHRFEELAERVLELIRQREGEAYNEVRARVALGMLIMLCQVALDHFVDTTDDRGFTDHYDEALAAVHTLLA